MAMAVIVRMVKAMRVRVVMTVVGQKWCGNEGPGGSSDNGDFSGGQKGGNPCGCMGGKNCRIGGNGTRGVSTYI